MPCSALQPTSKPGRPRHSVLRLLEGVGSEEFHPRQANETLRCQEIISGGYALLNHPTRHAQTVTVLRLTHLMKLIRMPVPIPRVALRSIHATAINNRAVPAAGL